MKQNRGFAVIWGLIFVAVVLVGGIYYFYKADTLDKEGNDNWMLSLYRRGETIMRLDYASKEACISAGLSYISDKSAERFDCGNKCWPFDKINLQESPVCETVCNAAGCR